MTAGTPAPQDAETVLAVGRAAQEAIDDIPYERADYSDEYTWRIAGEAVLAALSEVRAREVEAARHHAFCEGVKAAGSYGHEDGWTHDVNPYLDNPYRHLAATHAETEES